MYSHRQVTNIGATAYTNHSHPLSLLWDTIRRALCKTLLKLTMYVLLQCPALFSDYAATYLSSGYRRIPIALEMSLGLYYSTR